MITLGAYDTAYIKNVTVLSVMSDSPTIIVPNESSSSVTSTLGGSLGLMAHVD